MTKCDNCGYEWEYSGDLPWATCPACTRKTEVENNKEEKADGGEIEA